MKKSNSASIKPQKENRTILSERDIYSVAPGRYKPRSFLESGRWGWRTARQLARLTPLELRGHLAKDLREFGLNEQDQQKFLQALGTLPQEDSFWQTLQNVDQNYRLEEETNFLLTRLQYTYWPPAGSWFEQLHQAYVKIKTTPWQEFPQDSDWYQSKQDVFTPADDRWEVVFRNAFIQACGETPPPQWEEAAANVFVQIVWIRMKFRNYCQQRSRHLERLWTRGKTSGLVAAVRDGLFSESWVAQALSTLQWQQVTGETKEQQNKAAEILRQVGNALSEIVRGRTKMSPEKKQAIIEDCKKWRPICEELNTAFKDLWEAPEYEDSETYRKEARGRLAEKFSISVADVEAIEWSLKKPSQKAKKSTPTQAMCHMVARKHLGIGEKTVEKIWLDYLNNHPEESRKKRKTPTTASADERIA